MLQGTHVGDSFKLRPKNLIGFKKIHPDAVIPQRADTGCAGYDLTSIMDIVIPAHKSALVKTGLIWQPSDLIELQIRPRSGLAAKHMITVLNTPGTVDESYRGEICVILMNHSDIDYTVNKGDRIAQAVFAPILNVVVAEIEEVNATIRGDGAMGSTGK
ncbi:MAG: dUTP diphosphatase [Bacteroidetes bacterium HGW-Bacteroidetes-1]|nr:MAG: dUTP diphosphatase [Bacteroidetes bacterium HGW-Bacteroidetes-1]